MQPHNTSKDFERKRAAVRQMLYAEPASARLWNLLRGLSTPEHLCLAASDGILVLGHPATAQHARALVIYLQDKGFSATLKLSGLREDLDRSIAHVGVVILMLASQEKLDRDLQHYYAIAMMQGKIVIPIVRHPYDVPNLFFDVPPLVWGHDFQFLLHMVDELFTSPELEGHSIY